MQKIQPPPGASSLTTVSPTLITKAGVYWQQLTLSFATIFKPLTSFLTVRKTFSMDTLSSSPTQFSILP